MEQDRVTEVAKLPVGHRVDASLVDEQSAHRPRIDRASESLVGTGVLHDPTIPVQGQPAAGRSTRMTEAPDGRSIRVGSGRPASSNQARNPSRVASAVPW